MERTQVGIIGGGPAGLLLARILHLNGVDSVIFERQSREYVESRIRAGVLEQGSVNLLREIGAHERMDKLGIPHDGFALAFDGRLERVDMAKHAGSGVMIWGQTEVTRDLIALHLADGGIIKYETPAVEVEDVNTKAPRIIYEENGERKSITCDYVMGCDGYHGVSRQTIPADKLKTYEKIYPFGWLGILSDVPPVDEELIYANHERGFALCSMRSHTRSRYYIQCDLNDHVDNWTDDAFWDELRRRLPAHVAEKMVTGPRLEMSIAPLRSFVAEPMRYGNMFLAGDAAHIVPPTGAKGLNLAVSDIHYLSQALLAHYKDGEDNLLESYSATALRRAWKAIRFSWWFTSQMHRFDDDPINYRLQVAELDYMTGSEAGLTVISENYIGLPY